MSVVADRARAGPGPAVRALLGECVDYAGLFPPSELPLGEAVANYAEYRTQPDAWMLGRFVVPAGRLEEVAEAKETRQQTPRGLTVNAAWEISAVLGADPLKDVAAVGAFNARHRGELQVTAVEAKVATAAEAVRLAAALPADLELWVEFTTPGAEIPAELAAPNRGAKIRTGGVTPTSFPRAEQVAAFMLRCRRAGVRFKATAGLHHAITGEYPLTYAAGSARGRMFGFVNVLLAAAACGGAGGGSSSNILQEQAEGAETRQTGDIAQEGTKETERGRGGATVEELVAILECGDPAAFALEGDGVTWRPGRPAVGPRHFSTAELKAARTFLVSFGSCSFEEPIETLREIGWL